MAEADDNPIQCDGLQIGVCPHCSLVHINLFDEQDTLVASVAVEPKDWAVVVKAVEQQLTAASSADAIGPVAGRA